MLDLFLDNLRPLLAHPGHLLDHAGPRLGRSGPLLEQTEPHSDCHLHLLDRHGQLTYLDHPEPLLNHAGQLLNRLGRWISLKLFKTSHILY